MHVLSKGTSTQVSGLKEYWASPSSLDFSAVCVRINSGQITIVVRPLLDRKKIPNAFKNPSASNKKAWKTLQSPIG
jgi:hypothetical protein